MKGTDYVSILHEHIETFQLLMFDNAQRLGPQANFPCRYINIFDIDFISLTSIINNIVTCHPIVGLRNRSYVTILECHLG
jgi:hypothetical protein